MLPPSCGGRQPSSTSPNTTNWCREPKSTSTSVTRPRWNVPPGDASTSGVSRRLAQPPPRKALRYRDKLAVWAKRRSLHAVRLASRNLALEVPRSAVLKLDEVDASLGLVPPEDGSAVAARRKRDVCVAARPWLRDTPADPPTAGPRPELEVVSVTAGEKRDSGAVLRPRDRCGSRAPDEIPGPRSQTQHSPLTTSQTSAATSRPEGCRPWIQ